MENQISENRSFKHNPSDSYWKTVQVLTELLDMEGLDSVQRAYADAVQNTIFLNYAANDQLQQSALPGDVASLNRGHAIIAGRSVRLKCEDHSTLWLKDGKPYRYVTQPYKLEISSMRELVDYCDRNSLSVRVNAFQSWHFPGNSLMVELKKRGE